MKTVFAWATGLVVILACTQLPPGAAGPGTPIGDAASLAAPSASDGPCGNACAVLLQVGCHPTPECVSVCQSGLAAKLFPEIQVVCVEGSTNALGVSQCGGGWCRMP
jgi:hypothetical protein